MALITAADIPTGLITGNFFFVSEDNEDAGTDPTLTAVSGTVTFTAVTDKGATIQRLQLIGKMASAIPREFNAKFDSQGQLVPVNGNGIGIRVPASSAPEFNPTGWKWRVDYNLTYAGTNRTVNLPSHHITVGTGETVDLTAEASLQETETVLTTRGETGPQGPKGDKGDTGPAGAVSNISYSPRYVLNANSVLYIPDADIPRSASIQVYIDGDQPGPLHLQMYRSGTWNGVAGIAVLPNRWQIGGTTEPLTPTHSFSVFIENNLAGGRLGFKNTNNYARAFRIYWFAI